MFFKVLCHLKVLILRSKAKTGLEEIEERLGTWSVRLKKSNSWWESRISTSAWHSACAQYYWHIIIWGRRKYCLQYHFFLVTSSKHKIQIDSAVLLNFFSGQRKNTFWLLLPAWLMFLRKGREWRFLQLRACSVTERQRDSILVFSSESAGDSGLVTKMLVTAGCSGGDPT